MKFKILVSTSPGWITQPIEANLTTQIDIFSFSRALLSLEKLKDPPELIFDINQTDNLPDFISSGVFWLFSDRFLDVLRRFSVPFESIPVTLIGKKTKLSKYHLFHLLDVRSIVDLNKSELQSRTNIKSITLFDLKETDEPMMVRDAYLLSLVFVRNDLIQAIQHEQISGCDWMEPADYNFILNKKRW